MSLFQIFSIASSGLAAQSQRLNTVASNLANADSTAGPGGKPYAARQAVFETVPVGGTGGGLSGGEALGVRISGIVESNAPARRVHDPKHPMADAQGYVQFSNVNPVEEMVNMIAASRAYQSNVEVMNTAKTLLAKTLNLGQ